MNKGMLIVVSAPAGCGKDTIIEKLFETKNEICYSVSATTREIRDGEEEGKHYFFKTREQFEQMIADGDFLEYADYCGNYYGTPKAAVTNALESGKDILLKIEIEGAANIKSLYPDSVSIFISPPSIDELRRRLEKRGTEDKNTIELRIEIARREIALFSGYDYNIINDCLGSAVNQLIEIIHKEKQKRI
ncbi:MAG: guanylate kinase [Oscillospiraceae bacterium]|nr:guanylate kinase [Oscillospiraceae bacterium]